MNSIPFRLCTAVAWPLRRDAVAQTGVAANPVAPRPLRTAAPRPIRARHRQEDRRLKLEDVRISPVHRSCTRFTRGS
jgi:hypothetical protein